MEQFHLQKIEVPALGVSLETSKDLAKLFHDSDILNQLEEEFGPFLNFDRPFKRQLHLGSVPLLYAFFPKEKLLRVASSRLNSEMFALELTDAKEMSSEYREFVESIATLDDRQAPTTWEMTTKKYHLHSLIFEEEVAKKIQVKSESITSELLTHLNSYRPTLFEKLSDWGLGLTAQYALLRIHMLKYLAILPSLDHDKEGHEVKRILIESFRRLADDSARAKKLEKKGQNRALPGTLISAVLIGKWLLALLPAHLAAKFIRTSVRIMAKRFIAGENIQSAEESFRPVFESGRDVTLDQLGELVVSEKEADHYQNEVINLVRGFGQHVDKGARNQAGINRAHVSIKVSALCSDFKPEAPDYTYQMVAPRLKKILLAAKEESVFINIDAEHIHYRDIVFKVYQRLLLETPELRSYADTGIVLQAYLRDAGKHLDEIIQLAKERNLVMPVRLVKGAYWDAETVEANAHGHDAPEFLNKEETDLNFRQMIVKILENSKHLKLCLASHNYNDHAFAEAVKEIVYPEAGEIEHQCLHMTYEALSTALAKMNWATRNYVPIGSLLVGMAYLVRRIMENSSQVGVLTIMRSHKKKQKMIDPLDIHRENKEKGILDRDQTVSKLTRKFFNAPLVRTYLDNERAPLVSAYERFKTSVPLVLTRGQEISGYKQKIYCNSKSDLLVGEIYFAAEKDVEKHCETIKKSYLQGNWSDLPWQKRALVLERAANIMLIRRNELSALISYEAGKAIKEALADVDEAIDFLKYYARSEARLFSLNDKVLSRGPTLVISPWNFPIAIPCGMVVAPLVAGNPVVLKSAEQTPLIAETLVRLLHDAGVPKDALIHLPGEGETIGAKLVASDAFASIVFTGSKSVGMMISKQAGKRLYHNHKFGLRYPVKVITEMGGKNAIIVTANAELDETVAGILYSSFAHAGQKCSAASRVLVDSSIAGRLKERLKEAVRDLKIGEAYRFETEVNPVVTKFDKERIKKTVVEAGIEARDHGGEVVIDRSGEELPGECVGPAVIELPPGRSLEIDSWSVKEVFGPVVHLIPFQHLDQALSIFNGTEYALTGGVFSQSQDDIDYLTGRMECGNIYVNRTITGARVGIEPFGGFKLSGTGPKAGSRSYVPVFHLNLNDENLSVIHYGEDDGSEYDYDLARPSGLKVGTRLIRIEQATLEVLKNFETLFQGVFGDQKLTLERYHKWLKKQFERYQTGEHQNVVIPGQLSFTDLKLVKEHALVIAYADRAPFLTFMQVLSGLAVGTGMTVACRSEKAFQWWSGIRDLFVNAGISKENFDVYFSNRERLETALKHPKLSLVILDGDEKLIGSDLAKIYHDEQNELRVKTVLCPFDGPFVSDFKALCEQFILVRSFAVNVMRHGAPLEVELTS